MTATDIRAHGAVPGPPPPNWDGEPARLMLLARGLERQALALRRSPGRGRRPEASSLGSEALGVGAASALRPTDRLFAPERFLAAHLARGLAPEDFLLRCLGGSDWTWREEALAMGYAPAGTELVDLAAGAALALQLRGLDGVAMALVPAQAARQSRTADALARAASRRLPLVVIVEAGVDPPEAKTATVVDAFDPHAVAHAARVAVDGARAGGEAAVITCRPGAPLPDGASDPVERELRRLARESGSPGLIVALACKTAVEVRAAAARARSLHRGEWRAASAVA